MNAIVPLLAAALAALPPGTVTDHPAAQAARPPATTGAHPIAQAARPPAAAGTRHMALAAHPLGDFSVNHYDGLTIRPDRAEVVAIVDSAEIPTMQQGPIGSAVAHARRGCSSLREAIRAQADGRPLAWDVTDASFTYLPGAAGLRTSRLTCRLTAPLRVDRPLTLTFADGYLTGTIGWREITANGHGVRLSASSVPAHSVSRELRDYPADLLSSPLDIREARITVEPGDGGTAAPASAPGTGIVDIAGSLADRVVSVVTRWTGMLADRLNGLIAPTG